MILNSQGYGHFLHNINNQDFSYETPRMLLVLDGCSGAKYSEVGTRLFAQLFSRKEECDSVEKFESNVKEVFDDIIQMFQKYYPDFQTMEKKFILENMLFTIIACFKLKDKYVVKMFGDGYIITQNMKDKISYIKFSYGKYPPYFAYTYCDQPKFFKEYKFKTFEFDKKFFKNVGIASDGILPIVKGELNIDNYIFKNQKSMIEFLIRQKRREFGDDVTLLFFNEENLGGIK